MQVLEAGLAFAITMLILSLVVSGIVEAIQSLFGLREKGLRFMLGQVYEEVLLPYVKQAVDSGTRFVTTMTANRAPSGPAAMMDSATGEKRFTGTPGTEPGLFASRLKLSRIWGGDELGKLGVTEFMERLGSDPLGRQIIEKVKEKGEEFIEPVLKDIAQTFEAFGREASVYFAARARLISVVVAVFVAFALHVDAFDLFRTFLRDPVVRAKVIAEADKVLKTVEEARQAPAVPASPRTTPSAAAATTPTSPSPAAPATTPTPAPAPAPAVASAPATQVAAASAEDPQVKEVREKYETALKKYRDAETQLRDLGVQVGWTNARWEELWKPVCAPEPEVERSTVGASDKKAEKKSEQKAGQTTSPTVTSTGPRCPSGQVLVAGNELDWWRVIKLLFSMLLAGILIGLGGPFWYDVVKNLTAVRSMVRSVTGGAEPTSPAPDTRPGATEPPKDMPQPRTPAAIFQAAYDAQVVIDGRQAMFTPPPKVPPSR